MSKAYRVIVTAAEKFVPTKLRPLWEHEAGKTFFCYILHITQDIFKF